MWSWGFLGNHTSAGSILWIDAFSHILTVLKASQANAKRNAKRNEKRDTKRNAECSTKPYSRWNAQSHFGPSRPEWPRWSLSSTAKTLTLL